MFSVTLDITFTLSLQETTEEQPRIKIKTVRFAYIQEQTHGFLHIKI